MIDPDMKEVADALTKGERKVEPEEVKYSEPKYTMSFINGSPGLVVRAENSKEMENAMNAILPYFKRFREAVEVATATKSEAPKSENRVVCQECGTAMEHRSGFNKEKGKKWEGYFCPQDKAHPPVWI